MTDRTNTWRISLEAEAQRERSSGVCSHCGLALPCPRSRVAALRHQGRAVTRVRMFNREEDEDGME